VRLIFKFGSVCAAFDGAADAYNTTWKKAGQGLSSCIMDDVE